MIPREQFHRMNIMLYGVYSEIEELSEMFRVVVYGFLITLVYLDLMFTWTICWMQVIPWSLIGC